jgi:hypothetical protein
MALSRKSRNAVPPGIGSGGVPGLIHRGRAAGDDGGGIDPTPAHALARQPAAADEGDVPNTIPTLYELRRRGYHLLDEIRGQYPRAYESWTAAEEEQLKQLIQAGMTPEYIAQTLQRQASAIRSRMVRLGLAR